jgi:hypothetical protein
MDDDLAPLRRHGRRGAEDDVEDVAALSDPLLEIEAGVGFFLRCCDSTQKKSQESEDWRKKQEFVFLIHHGLPL